MSVIKEYNRWELRFLQVLVPKEQYYKILHYNWQIHIDQMLFRGTKVLRHPNGKLEFVDAIKSPPLSEAGNDYLDTLKSFVKALRKPEMDMGWFKIEGEKDNDDN